MRYGLWTEDEYAVVPPDHYLVLGDNYESLLANAGKVVAALAPKPAPKPAAKPRS